MGSYVNFKRPEEKFANYEDNMATFNSSDYRTKTFDEIKKIGEVLVNIGKAILIGL